ncbi:MAG: hypothetical protein ABIO06_00830 [Pseudolysinimonas sp.]
MGKHVNADAGSDEGEAQEFADAELSADPQHEPARHVAESGHPLEPQAVISPDTHVGVGPSAPPAGAADAAPSPANPDALVEHGLVGDGHEME